MRAYRPEAPLVLPNGPTYNLAERVTKWIDERWIDERRIDERREPTSNGGWVVGIYGGRGTGKTSFLLTLHDLLRRGGDAPTANGDSPAYVLPNVATELAARALFAPTATRKDDDLLFLLLEHLESYYGKEPRESFAQARTAEVRRKDLEPFIEYERDVSASATELPKRLVELHNEVATTTRRLRDAFQEIVQYHTRSGRIFPLFVDDLDLRPERALELLEIAHLFLDHRRVVVIVTADKDLLIHAIDHALSKRGLRHSGLAGALLTKYVPSEWMLPVPDEKRRLDELWPEKKPEQEGVDPALPAWWPEATAKVFADPPPPIRDKANELLGPLLPSTYRGLVAMHNRLLTLEDDFGVRAGTDDFLRTLRVRFMDELGIAEPLVPPFLSMCAAIDVQSPELGLLAALNDSVSLFREILERVSDPSGKGRRTESGAAELPVLDRLRAPHLEGRSLGKARRLLLMLVAHRKTLQEESSKAQPGDRFLAVSLNSNALEASEDLWRDKFSERQILHIDLRPFAPTGRATPEELRNARRRARQEIVVQHLRESVGRVELFTSAQLPFLIWLGWELRYLHAVTVYNYQGQEEGRRRFAPFMGPAATLTFPDRGVFDRLTLDPALSTEKNANAQAVVIVDLLGKSAPAQLDWFIARNRIFVETPDHHRLVRRSRERIEPADLVPILSDILELFGQLRRDRGIRRVHLGFAGPDVVAFFLGQQLNAQGMQITLYELYADRYDAVFDLEEGAAEDA
jgi:hypothetical protein